MNNTQTSRYLSKILRHQPEIAGIKLDKHGWADVNELLAAMHIDKTLLEDIVAKDAKGRYAFNADKSRIRAVQGHSIQVDADLAEAVPPAILWHGTAEKSVPSIMQKGLLPMSRLYVHLSADKRTARIVGARHGKPYVFEVDAQKMIQANIPFYLSENGVWLVKHVPPAFLKPDND